jgi:hypothetical protein
MADSFIYATAQAFGATLWTQDDHFKGLPRVNYKEARTTPSYAVLLFLFLGFLFIFLGQRAMYRAKTASQA